MIYATSRDLEIDWAESIPYVELGLRSTKKSSTKVSPHEAVFGKRIILPWTKNKSTTHGNELNLTYLDNLNINIGKVHDDILLNQKLNKSDQINSYELNEKVMVRKKKQ